MRNSALCVFVCVCFYRQQFEGRHAGVEVRSVRVVVLDTERKTEKAY